MDLGFHKAGFNVVWSNDFDPDCCLTYRTNFKRITGRDALHEGDISEIKPPSKKSIGKLDVLLAGFPCQAFSNAGNRKGLNDKRGSLYEYCIDYVDRFSPSFTVFENVRGFLTIPGKKKLLIEEIADELCKLNYDVYVNLMNASHYNVPQNRLRVFMIGVKRGANLMKYSFPNQKNGEDLTLGNLLKVPANTPNQKDIVQLNPQAYEIGAMVPEGGSWKDIPYNKLPPRLKKIKDNIRKYRWPNFYRRFSRKEIAGTVTAAFKPENAGVWHPVKKRTFSAREIARIQSFPDDFAFKAHSVKSIYQMIGNAVPPLMAQAVAESILQTLKASNVDRIKSSYYDRKASGIPFRVGSEGWAF